jgi:hypothetical protein
VLGELTIADPPDGVGVEVETLKAAGHYLMDWSGSLFKDTETVARGPFPAYDRCISVYLLNA